LATADSREAFQNNVFDEGTIITFRANITQKYD
jgi:hypothetical protein